MTLQERRGELSLYEAVKNKWNAEERKETLIDFGFNIWRHVSLENKEDIRENRLFRVEKKSESYHITDTFNDDRKIRSIMYTHKAYVEKVIDGDTLWADIDCGFDTFSRQKIRFRGIATPDRSFPEGKKALGFVQRALRDCGFIVIKTYKTDMYDRYVSDVFYLPKEGNTHIVSGKGIFLNQILLDKGLARMI